VRNGADVTDEIDIEALDVALLALGESTHDWVKKSEMPAVDIEMPKSVRTMSSAGELDTKGKPTVPVLYFWRADVVDVLLDYRNGLTEIETLVTPEVK
jgi:hypothetical protein